MFHLLYNPYFSDWKAKRASYVKYETLHKMQKRKKANKLWLKSTKEPESVNANDFV